MNSPAISVLMPVYNGEKHVAEAIDSILAQTFSGFEFIIIDDASTDATASTLEAYARQDARIRILTNTSNQKIAFSLNRGLTEAQAPLIARMDADDWSHPERLAQQYAFMQAHPEVTVCGTWLEVYDTGRVWDWAQPDAEIRAASLFNVCIAHPTAMFRKDAVLQLAAGYDGAMPPVEDYDMWARLMEHEEVHFANLPIVLLRYRTCPEKDRGIYRSVQRSGAQEVRRRLLRHMWLEPSEADMQCHYTLASLTPVPNIRALCTCRAWSHVLLAANERAKIYDAQVFRREVEGRWRELLRRSVRAQVSAWWVAYVPECIRARYRAVKKALQRRVTRERGCVSD